MEYMDNVSYANNNDPYTPPSVIPNLLSKEECNQIINYSTNKLEESTVVSGKDLSIRNSQQTWIKKDDPIIKPIIDRIIQRFGQNFDNAEDLQVVRYQSNQYYNEHHDSCCDDNDKCMEFIKRGGQRVLTVLIYLSDNFTGGQTYFKNLDLKLKPNVGDAIVFYPLAQNSNKCHPLALHGGLSVESGEKWIANLWFRESKFL
jgi:prolyl 4-hydroxylase